MVCIFRVKSMKKINTNKRKNYNLLILYIVLIMIMALLFSCNNITKEKEIKNRGSAGKLISFSYIYGTFRYRPFEYTIKRIAGNNDEEHIYFKAEGYSENLISIEKEIDEVILNEITRIMEEENIFAWDGFKEQNKEVRDGFSFELRVRFENFDIKANGYMKEPENFKQGHERLSKYLLKLTQNFKED